VRRAVFVYVGMCCGLAAVATAALVLLSDTTGERPWLAPVLGLGLLVEFAYEVRFRYRGEQGQSVTHDECFFVLGVFLVEPYVIVVALGLALLVADLALRQPPLKTLFNAAKSVGSMSIGLLVIDLIGDVGSLTPRGAVAAAVGGLVCVALNDAAVAGVVTLAGREPLAPMLLDDLRGRALVWAGNVSIGLLAGLAVARDLTLLPFALVAIVALHFALWGHARARAERDKSQEREQLLQAILDGEPNHVMLVRRDGAVEFVNPAGARLLRVPGGGTVIGTSWHDLVAPESRDDVEAMLAAGFAEGASRGEVSIDHDGERRTLESTVAPVTDEFDDVVSVVVVSRDITVQRRLEGQLRQAQRLEAVGQLAGGIAHDFNNLLTAIGGYSELALAQLGPEAAGARADVEEIRRASERAAGLTRQLLAFSRREVLDPTVFDLNLAVADVESLLCRLLGEHIAFETIPDPLGCPIAADRGQVEQVLMNLALNARDAMPQGGTLRIATDNVGPQIRLRITDTGVGMDAAVRERIFEPFFTTKQPGEGTGLGLAMVFGIMEETGGAIDVHSTPGVGTTFVLTFPRAAQESGSKTATADSGIGPRSQRTRRSSTSPRAAASPST
jgi:PAS domain S-box-containing protein